MGRRSYAFEPGGRRVLEIRWTFRFRQVEIALEDGPRWTLDRAAFLAGVTQILPDGSSLFVRWVKRKWYSIGLRDELRVERDGLPVPGSDGHPRVLGRRVAWVILLLAIFRVLFVFGVMDARSDPLGSANLLPEAELALVIALGVLAAFGIRVAVLIAAVLFAVEALAAIAFIQALPLFQGLVAANFVFSWRRMKPAVRVPNLGEVFD